MKIPSVTPKRARYAFAAFGLFLLLQAVPKAQTIEKYFVWKAIEYHQTSWAAPTVYTSDPTGAYGYDVGVTGTSLGGLAAPSFTGPSLGAPSGTLSYNAGQSRWDATGGFSSKAALDLAFPNGQYNLTIPGYHSNTPIALTLAGDAYPTTTPQVTGTSQTGAYWNSTTGALMVDPTQSLSISFSPFSQLGTGIGSREVFTIYGLGSSSTFGPGDLAINIPANSFVSGTTYTAVFEFDWDTTLDATSISGAKGTAVYANQTVFTITAIPEPTTTVMLFGIAAIALSFASRRRVARPAAAAASVPRSLWPC